jgi:peptidoglycan/xylan/chitin deacetylase (PgdA/CDA1 family)
MSPNPWLLGVPCAVTALAGAAAYAGAYPRAQWFGRTVCSTSSPEKLAITFDDGPNPSITPKLLDLLDAHHARATFFLIGRFVRECPDLVRETVARGHLIANHTQTHPNLFWCSPAAIRAELRQCSEAIAEAAGAPPKWFRPPYGFRNPWVVSTARALQMRTVMWTLIPGDWLVRPTEWLVRRMSPIGNELKHRKQRGLANRSGYGRGGDILCLHDGSHRTLNGDRSHTLGALEYWLPRWRDLGLQFVTIAEAVGAPAS